MRLASAAEYALMLTDPGPPQPAAPDFRRRWPADQFGCAAWPISASAAPGCRSTVPGSGCAARRRPRRANRSRRTGELAYYRCYAPGHVPLAVLVRVAGRRWSVEEDFQVGKSLAGLDEHQVRRWTSWYRWVTLAMLACAFLTVAAAAEHARGARPAGQVPLTRNEIARLAAALIIQPASGARHRLHWPAWRRQHQHTARACHYQRQAARDP